MRLAYAYKLLEEALKKSACLNKMLPAGADPADHIVWPEHQWDCDPDGCPIIPDTWVGIEIQDGSTRDKLTGTSEVEVAFWVFFKPKDCDARERTCQLLECADCFECEICALIQGLSPGRLVSSITYDQTGFAEPDQAGLPAQDSRRDFFRIILTIT